MKSSGREIKFYILGYYSTLSIFLTGALTQQITGYEKSFSVTIIFLRKSLAVFAANCCVSQTTAHRRYNGEKCNYLLCVMSVLQAAGTKHSVPTGNLTFNF